MPNTINTIEIKDLMERLRNIPGGYVYGGACSYQVCFPLKGGGELRFMLSDGPDEGEEEESSPGDISTESGIFNIDLYGGELPPGISGPAFSTGQPAKV